MNIFGVCPYETPCGWCSKWDKKCDEKMPKKYRDPIVIKPIDDHREITLINKPCSECDKEGWSMPECAECNAKNDFRYFERKRDNND